MELIGVPVDETLLPQFRNELKQLCNETSQAVGKEFHKVIEAVLIVV